MSKSLADDQNPWSNDPFRTNLPNRAEVELTSPEHPSYIEPTFTTPVPPPDDSFSPKYTSTYPPAPQNPFNRPRPTSLSFGTPNSNAKSPNSAPLGESGTPTRPNLLATPSDSSQLSGLSSPGTDGPLNFTYPTSSGFPSRSSAKGNKKRKQPVILGVAVVDFNHMVGPIVEWSYPPRLTRSLHKDEELGKLLPFLALPDGAHLSEEDYSYFHCMYNPPHIPIPLSSAQLHDSSSTPTKASSRFRGQTEDISPSHSGDYLSAGKPLRKMQDEDDDDDEEELPERQTIFGISCNRQLPASELLVKLPDVTRSTVQKAVVVLANRPVFGPIRDKLGVVTRALFAQRDFTRIDLLPLFYESLEQGIQGKAEEGEMYIGTSLRELLHKFRHKTLTLVKMMMLQKRILFFGYPVERLCTYQYSLISLMPGLLMNLVDSGDPSLDFRTGMSRRPSSLRTSDRNSLLRYMGLPLHTFGHDAFFQPYLPLQQIDMLQAESWLVGTTNQIVTQQRDCQWDLLVNIEQTSFEFYDPKVERLVALTPSDRLWMDQVVKSVEETWNPADPTRPIGLVFRGSDDDLRRRFEEYICSALSTLKYQDYVAKGQNGPPLPGELRPNLTEPFSTRWIEAFKQTPAYLTWDDSTDELLFDICEPRHPCGGQANAVADIGIRLTEGIHDLGLDKQIGTGREAIGTAFAAGSSTLFSAFNGVRSEVANRLRDREYSSGSKARPVSTPVVLKTDGKTSDPVPITTNAEGSTAPAQDIKAMIGGWGTFLGSKVASFQKPSALPAGLKEFNLKADTTSSSKRS